MYITGYNYTTSLCHWGKKATRDRFPLRWMSYKFVFFDYKENCYPFACEYKFAMPPNRHNTMNLLARNLDILVIILKWNFNFPWRKEYVFVNVNNLIITKLQATLRKEYAFLNVNSFINTKIETSTRVFFNLKYRVIIRNPKKKGWESFLHHAG